MTTTAASTQLTVDVVTDADMFRALEPRWRDLYEASGSATPFQTWEWLFTWWEVYGTRGALCLVTVRDGDRLVGVLPLMAVARGTLRFIGTGLSDHLDALVDDAAADAVLDAWTAHLYRRGVHLLDLHEVRPEAAVWRLYERWPGRTASYEQSACAEFDVAPLDDLLPTWSRNTRAAARLALKRLDNRGYRWHWATPDEIGDLAEQLVVDHQRAWEGRGISPAHADPRFATFVRAVCERMAPHGEVALTRLDAPDDVAEPMTMLDMYLVGRQYVGGWLSANNDVMRRRVTVAVVEGITGIELTNQRGVGVMSMLRGLEAGKLKLHDRVKINHRLLLAGRGATGTAVWARRTTPVALIAGVKRWEKHSATGQRVAGALRSTRDRLRR